jgi:DNA-binding MarR family transcriptional regulator
VNDAHPETHVSVSVYLDLVRHVERMHGLLGKLIREELSGHGFGSVNHTQALILLQIADTVVHPKNLQAIGIFGSNVSYNLSDLIDHGYVYKEVDPEDRRKSKLSLSSTGRLICGLISEMLLRHAAEAVETGYITIGSLEPFNAQCARIERYWADIVAFKI